MEVKGPLSLWNQACVEEVGVADNETILRVTRLGAVAQAFGVPIYWHEVRARKQEVADFLRALAGAIEKFE